MTSIALRRLGHRVKIFEQAPTPLLHDQGAGIVAGGETQEFLKKFDITHTPNSVPSRERYYLNKKGDIINRESSLQHMTSWDLLYNIFRTNFDGFPNEYVPGEDPAGVKKGEGEGVYQHGRRVREVKAEGERVKVLFHSTIEGEDREEIREEMADFVIVADGASSAIRQQLSRESKPRSYVGYVAFRGTIPETEISKEAAEVFVEKFPFFHAKGIQILAYIIPGKKGSVDEGKRLVNWVWYWNIEEDSPEYREVFTDKHGHAHKWTLPPGNNMASKVWERQQKRARDLLPPQFAELVLKTKSPFVQAVTDLEPPADGRVWKLDGKVVLAGDAVAGFRPHTAASTSQAAFHALQLHQVFAGEMGREDFEREAMRYATEGQRRGVQLGNRSQFGDHPFSGTYGQSP